MRTGHLVSILVLLALVVPTSSAHAGGIVSVCDEVHLLAALAGGGTVTFTCSGTITLIAPITIATDTTIDGSGQDVTISGNHAVRVFYVNTGVTLNLNELTVANGNFVGNGGGIYNDAGQLVVSNSTFSGNSAEYGGGIFNYQGTLTVLNGIFSGNTVVNYGSGGAIYSETGQLTVINSTFSGNRADEGGGAGINSYFSTVTVSNSTFSRNAASAAGCIFNYGGTLTVNKSTFSSNAASGSPGGGIFNWDGTLTVRNSTFSGNSAASGGGISNWGGTITVSNSTFSANSAVQVGGGILSDGYNAIVTVSNSTFSYNAAGSGGGGFANLYGMLTLKNTIVVNSPAGGNCGGSTITDGGGNLSYPDTTCPGINADPKLGPLQNNGGPTHTMALGPGSAAIDAGIDTACSAPPIDGLDQRGVFRPQGAHCDIGAFEWVCPSFVLPATVGVEDIVAMATRWGWKSSTPGWDPAYDLNMDNNIDMVDIVLVTSAWGHQCS